jgi:hypothetical protein
MLFQMVMRHHPTASALLETPYLDVARGALPTLPVSPAWTADQRLMAAVLDDAVRPWRRCAPLPGRPSPDSVRARVGLAYVADEAA